MKFHCKITGIILKIPNKFHDNKKSILGNTGAYWNLSKWRMQEETLPSNKTIYPVCRQIFFSIILTVYNIIYKTICCNDILFYSHVTKCDEKICALCAPMKEKYYDLAYTEARNNARDIINALRKDKNIQLFRSWLLNLTIPDLQGSISWRVKIGTPWYRQNPLDNITPIHLVIGRANCMFEGPKLANLAIGNRGTWESLEPRG